ncbi:ribosome hibernation-promoting factor, HPF/YfiA family [Actinoalloteichus hymeniacidonis]|uniref:Ribosome hibernation promoting factor n=1 Tax=Actinoalloteichus hymeniacidonis TaxID=340345 RepID=A0AAC9HTZ8_9PSEU|nr:ribosome-associated translation inhibitor RaiA [Actinoalloteichus hymeniacidonis]AOS65433.1 ribosomal subunit interface protein [Actinoalloteichus hymeniacidonis]MBB5906480.1 ribosomal subunit interface protein [Actinoalloteichus hymeniacidonis]
MDIVVKGRNVEVPEHYRAHVADKLDRLERYDRKVISFDVELFHEPNPRQTKNCQRVEITGKGKGPVIRAEATAADFYAALDGAVAKLESRLRRAHDRRRVHYGRRNPTSVAEATAIVPDVLPDATTGHINGKRGSTAVLKATEVETAEPQQDDAMPAQRWQDLPAAHEPGQIVREKVHPSTPMTVDQALYEMELVGHDFYLFSDAESGRPSVVYRRRGFDYGVIQLAA